MEDDENENGIKFYLDAAVDLIETRFGKQAEPALVIEFAKFMFWNDAHKEVLAALEGISDAILAE